MYSDAEPDAPTSDPANRQTTRLARHDFPPADHLEHKSTAWRSSFFRFLAPATESVHHHRVASSHPKRIGAVHRSMVPTMPELRQPNRLMSIDPVQCLPAH